MLNAWRAVLKRLSRLLRYHLIIPLHRSRHSPQYTARGVFIGLFIAFTPTVGIQMPIVLVAWGMARAIHRSWDFNLIAALAWTWVTNVFTVPPIYYGFFITGRILLGRSDDLPGYGDFARQISASLKHGDGMFAATMNSAVTLFDAFGLPLFFGSLPWAVLFSAIGYAWTLKIIRHHRKAREERRRRRFESRHPA
jgi:uncharacterized protein